MNIGFNKKKKNLSWEKNLKKMRIKGKMGYWGEDFSVEDLHFYIPYTAGLLSLFLGVRGSEKGSKLRSS
jgi:hypothetical protein